MAWMAGAIDSVSPMPVSPASVWTIKTQSS
jgi:hypothetical protein